MKNKSNVFNNNKLVKVIYISRNPLYVWWSNTHLHLVAGDGLHVGGQDDGVHGVRQEQAQMCDGCGEGPLSLLSLCRKVFKWRKKQKPHD